MESSLKKAYEQDRLDTVADTLLKLATICEKEQQWEDAIKHYLDREVVMNNAKNKDLVDVALNKRQGYRR